MPARNGTGPTGLGPMTGRRAGVCGTSDPVNVNARGRGFACGTGHGRRHFLNDNVRTPENEKNILEQQLKNMKSDIEYMTKRIEELDNASENAE